MASISEIRAELERLGQEEKEFKKCVAKYQELEGLLAKHKESLAKITRLYNEAVAPYALLLLEAGELFDRIQHLSTHLEAQRPPYYLGDYGYPGNLHAECKDQAIHESVAPAITGKTLWPVVVQARKKGA